MKGRPILFNGAMVRALLEVVNRRALENTAPKPKATPRAVLRQVPSRRQAPPDLSAFLSQA